MVRSVWCPCTHSNGKLLSDALSLLNLFLEELPEVLWEPLHAQRGAGMGSGEGEGGGGEEEEGGESEEMEDAGRAKKAVWRHLRHLQQAVSLLAMEHKASCTLPHLRSLCPDLNANQLVHLCVWYQDDRYCTQGLPAAVVDQLWGEVDERTPMLLQETTRSPLSIADSTEWFPFIHHDAANPQFPAFLRTLLLKKAASSTRSSQPTPASSTDSHLLPHSTPVLGPQLHTLQSHGVPPYGAQSHGVQSHGVQSHGVQSPAVLSHGLQSHPPTVAKSPGGQSLSAHSELPLSHMPALQEETSPAPHLPRADLQAHARDVEGMPSADRPTAYASAYRTSGYETTVHQAVDSEMGAEVHPGREYRAGGPASGVSMDGDGMGEDTRPADLGRVELSSCTNQWGFTNNVG
ncbi:hypothetical protein CLOP_g14006 [Closterium sp. NIES-67]|nr:hypothetical protein CLOP_g14006 [Closterium sp. NIES-67]